MPSAEDDDDDDDDEEEDEGDVDPTAAAGAAALTSDGDLAGVSSLPLPLASFLTESPCSPPPFFANKSRSIVGNSTVFEMITAWDHLLYSLFSKSPPSPRRWIDLCGVFACIFPLDFSKYLPLFCLSRSDFRPSSCLFCLPSSSDADLRRPVRPVQPYDDRVAWDVAAAAARLRPCHAQCRSRVLLLSLW